MIYQRFTLRAKSSAAKIIVSWSNI